MSSTDLETSQLKTPWDQTTDLDFKALRTSPRFGWKQSKSAVTGCFNYPVPVIIIPSFYKI